MATSASIVSSSSSTSNTTSPMTTITSLTANNASAVEVAAKIITTATASMTTTTTTTAVTMMTNVGNNNANVNLKQRQQERENLRNIILQWNANRLDLFEISEPNDDLEFYGVMRFYFQDAGQKVATKCMRISSTASTSDVINNLIEKFRPDIRMLSVPEYALYEIHENGDERKLSDKEFPLLVQLNWHKDDREGRFLLRRMDEKTYLPGFNTGNSNIFNRKLSKRERKEKKKKEKKEKGLININNSKDKDKDKDNNENFKGDNLNNSGATAGHKDSSLAEKLYTELPETSFTRSISNPEAVMRRRRQQKLEKKLQQFSQEGGPEAGGTLRIFGESINQDVPYKTILLSTRDTAAFAVKEILEKYGKDKEDPQQYCLVQVIVPYLNGSTNITNNNGDTNNVTTNGPKSLPNMNQTVGLSEFILDDDDCPLIIERSHNKQRGVLTFHIRRRPPDYQPRRRKKKQSIGVNNTMNSTDNHNQCDPSLINSNNNKIVPFLIEVEPDGSEIFRSNYIAKHYYLNANLIEIGTDVEAIVEKTQSSNTVNSNHCALQLVGPNIQAHHCTIANTDDVTIITPSSRESETYINGTRIYDSTVLKPGMLIRFGKLLTFKFVDENALKRHSQISAGATIGHQSNTNHAHSQQQQFYMNESVKSSMNPSYETTFDADGKVETSCKPETLVYNTGSLQRHQTLGSLPRSSIASNIEMSTQSNHARPAQLSIAQPQQPLRKGDNILPAILEVGEELEDVFLTTIIKRVDPNQVQFKLCITYSLYMVTRYRASTYFKPEITPEIRAELLIAFCIKYANMIQQTINDNHSNQSSLAFWLANSSEILHFLKNDRHLSAFTFDSQDIMAESVQISFNYLVTCQQNELKEVLSSFTKDIVDQNNNAMDTITQNILKILSNSMQLLRRFRVNAALTIQLFSQLFHFINMSLFNKVIGTPETNFCSRIYGIKLRQCLSQIELWAEKQGLELAAECHLSRIIQTAIFLQGPKKCPEDLNGLVANFYKLNSIQLQALCERYQPCSDEVSFTAESIQNMVQMARNTTDELILKEGREIRLEEESDLQLPFLLPEDGYSCDIVRGIPTGLQEFVQTLVHARICSLTIQPTASGYWTIYFINFQAEQQQQPRQQLTPSSIPYQEYQDEQKSRRSISDNRNTMSSQQYIHPHQQSKMLTQVKSPMAMMMNYPNAVNNINNAYGSVRMMPEPEIHVIKLQKINNGIGLSIVAARGTNQTQLGIYIKSVVKGGAADMDGRLEAGDQLLKVDGQSLIGMTQEKAAELMTQTGPIVTLEVAKQGALFHGLGGILTQQQSQSALMAKNLRPRFIADYGNNLHRYPVAANTNGQFSPMSSQQNPMPGYNSLPLSLNYNYQNQTSNTLPYNNNSTINNPMRPESQLSYNSATNLISSSLVTNNSSNSRNINLSTASLPAHASIAATQQQHFHPLPEERHYQNIQLYQLNHPAATTAPSQANNGQMSSLQKLSPNINNSHQSSGSNVVPVVNRSMLHGSHSSLQQHSSSLLPNSNGELASPTNFSRPVSAIVTTREQEQIFNQNVAASGSTVNASKHTGEHYYSQQHHRQHSQQLPDVNQTFIDPQFRQHQLRQEAKMEEIREELRRREDRVQQHQQLGTMSRAVSMSNSAINPHVLIASNNSNNSRPRFTSQQSLAFNSQQSNGLKLNNNERSATLGSLIRSNPPQPAPKPMRSIPLASNNNNNVQQMNYRFGPSGYPPSSQAQQQQQPYTQAKSSSPSPWEREEKEKEIQQKIEETKRSRDEEIKYLESLPYRNPKSEERLRKLILEREFQKRAAEEMNENDDDDYDEEDDDEMLDRAERRERMLAMHQDRERSRQRRIQQQLMQKEQLSQRSNFDNDDTKKRQDETNKMKYEQLPQQNETPPPLPKSSPPLESANQRLDRLIMNTMKNENINNDINDNSMTISTHTTRMGVLKNSNLNSNNYESNNNNNKSMKKVSWNDNPTTNIVLNNVDEDDEDEDVDEEDDDDGNDANDEETDVNDDNDQSFSNDKSMSVHSQVMQNISVSKNNEMIDDDDEQQEDRFSLQDIDDVLGGTQSPNSKNWFNNNYVSGNTPGVIGAQEVYNDPRKRIEAERFKSSQNQIMHDKLPEKLTFQEKMKMFAKTTGANSEAATSPIRGKIKVSKAQRDIEDKNNDNQDLDA